MNNKLKYDFYGQKLEGKFVQTMTKYPEAL